MVDERAQSNLALPTSIGPYQVQRTLGRGGMGDVYLGKKPEPGSPLVALKLIRIGEDADRTLARFETEREALTRMNHAHIAKILDAGKTPDGAPYFVMEYVDGVPITKYCDAQHSPLSDRIQLFRQVCEGVEHAHQQGVVHRDLKPSNILVTVEGERPVVKIIDFGVAKASAALGSETPADLDVDRWVGTPAFMSPEQVRGEGEDIDARTDVYSLGVVLYALTVGVLPFDPKQLRESSGRRVRQVLCEEVPEAPSVRWRSLGETGPGDSALVLATRRSTDKKDVASQLRGSLDWITMKCLEKSRANRYERVSNLNEDLGRHLEGARFSGIRRSIERTSRSTSSLIRGPLPWILAVVVGGGAVAVWSLAPGSDATSPRETIAAEQLSPLRRQAWLRMSEGEFARAEAELRLFAVSSHTGTKALREWSYDTAIATRLASARVSWQAIDLDSFLSAFVKNPPGSTDFLPAENGELHVVGGESNGALTLARMRHLPSGWAIELEVTTRPGVPLAVGLEGPDFEREAFEVPLPRGWNALRIDFFDGILRVVSLTEGAILREEVLEYTRGAWTLPAPLGADYSVRKIRWIPIDQE